MVDCCTDVQEQLYLRSSRDTATHRHTLEAVGPGGRFGSRLVPAGGDVERTGKGARWRRNRDTFAFPAFPATLLTKPSRRGRHLGELVLYTCLTCTRQSKHVKQSWRQIVLWFTHSYTHKKEKGRGGTTNNPGSKLTKTRWEA